MTQYETTKILGARFRADIQEGAGSSMRILPYAQTSSVPNVIVDGSRNENTVLTVSDWPKSGTLADLKGDTSTAIVLLWPNFTTCGPSVFGSGYQHAAR